MSYVQTAEARMNARYLHDFTLMDQQDIDSFLELSPLTLSQARLIMKDSFSLTKIQAIGLLVPKVIPITLLLGASAVPDESVEIKAFLYQNGAAKRDASAEVSWLTDPTPSTVVTILNGLITANTAGSVDVYASLGGIESARITITVA
ncbi:MAG: hypothetical protein Q7R33_02050 [Nitrosarchaeum sp.]|nr:hypothetical protein [Nitrosarchaeum sp.]